MQDAKCAFVQQIPTLVGIPTRETLMLVAGPLLRSWRDAILRQQSLSGSVQLPVRTTPVLPALGVNLLQAEACSASRGDGAAAHADVHRDGRLPPPRGLRQPAPMPAADEQRQRAPLPLSAAALTQATQAVASGGPPTAAVVRPQVRPALLPEPTVASGVGGAVRPAERATWCGAQASSTAHAIPPWSCAPPGAAWGGQGDPGPGAPPLNVHTAAAAAARGGSKLCVHPGCLKGAIGKLKLCIAHGGGKRCEAPGCHKAAQGQKPLCKAHGGGRRCKFPGCKPPSQPRPSPLRGRV